MIRRLIKTTVPRVYSRRLFGLRRPEDKLNIRSIKEYLRVDKSERSSAAKSAKQEVYSEEVEASAAPTTSAAPIDVNKKVQEIVDKLIPDFQFLDPYKCNRYSRYDSAMGRYLHYSKEMQDILKKHTTEHPIDPYKESRLRNFPMPRTLSIFANLQENEARDKSSKLMMTSTLLPGEKIAIPKELPLEFERAHMTVNQYVGRDALRKFVSSLYPPIMRALQGKQAITSLEGKYPPSLFTYYYTLPKWAQDCPAMRQTLIALEFYRPDVTMAQKEQGLNKVLRTIASSGGDNAILAEALFDNEREQMNLEKTEKMIDEEGLYPIITDLISDDEKEDLMFHDDDVLLLCENYIIETVWCYFRGIS